jgi:peptidoglycan/xylan/chitin deacetylase (PgdA/CDA1 family)
MLWFLIAGVAAVFLAHTAPFPFLLEAFAPGKSLWHMPRDPRAPAVYLTYDDGPNPSATAPLLDMLGAAGGCPARC